MNDVSMSNLKNNLDSSWLDVIGEEFAKPYMAKLEAFLTSELAAGKIIYPQPSDWFNAFNSTHFDQVKVIIIGQDPYHGVGQAHGLCFSVANGVDVPPSLKNIYKELNRDLHLPTPSRGCLSRWADQGVLLLNATLTVEQGRAGSHQGMGWEQFTDSAIRAMNKSREGLVFMLWGAFAKNKGKVIDRQKHLVLTAPHPSPLSAYRGFLGCGHFSKANDYLIGLNKKPIDWSVD
jgi:uracil-DNA glycosylase